MTNDGSVTLLQGQLGMIEIEHHVEEEEEHGGDGMFAQCRKTDV